MYIYYIHIPVLLIQNRVLLCYRNGKHAENAVKSRALALTHILLHEFVKSYFCYIKRHLGDYHAGKNRGKA